MNLPLPRPTFPPKIESFCFLLDSAFPSHHRVSHSLFGSFGGMCSCFTAKQLHLVTADSRNVRLIRGMKVLRGHAARGARAHLVAETPPHDFIAFSTRARTASRPLPWGLVLFHGSAKKTYSFTASPVGTCVVSRLRGSPYCFTASPVGICTVSRLRGNDVFTHASLIHGVSPCYFTALPCGPPCTFTASPWELVTRFTRRSLGRRFPGDSRARLAVCVGSPLLRGNP